MNIGSSETKKLYKGNQLAGRLFYVDEMIYGSEVHPFVPDWFKVMSLEDGNRIYYSNTEGNGCTMLQYSLDNGETWQDAEKVSDTYRVDVTLNTYKSVCIRGLARQTNPGQGNRFTTTKTVNLYGNIGTLLFAGDYINHENYGFILDSFFRNSSSLNYFDVKVVDASHLTLPKNAQLRHTFQGITTLQYGPNVCNTRVSADQLWGTFNKCSNLKLLVSYIDGIADGASTLNSEFLTRVGSKGHLYVMGKYRFDDGQITVPSDWTIHYGVLPEPTPIPEPEPEPEPEPLPTENPYNIGDLMDEDVYPAGTIFAVKKSDGYATYECMNGTFVNMSNGVLTDYVAELLFEDDECAVLKQNVNGTTRELDMTNIYSATPK